MDERIWTQTRDAAKNYRRSGTEAKRTGCTCPELTADMVMHARSGSKEKAHGPEDVVVPEMIQELT